MASDKPTELDRSRIPRWRDVWRDADNVLMLVEKELGLSLPRNGEIPDQVSPRYQHPLFQLLDDVGLSPPVLWRDLELIDALVCADANNVGPRTILHLVSELSDIARKIETWPEIDGPISISDEVLAAISTVPFDRIVYAFYGGSPSGFTRLVVDSERSRDDDHSIDIHDQLLVSDLHEAKRVLRNMAYGLERCGHLLSTDQALRWMWDGGALDDILERHCASPTESGRRPLNYFEAAVPVLRARVADGKSIGEIGRTFGTKEYRVRDQIVKWAHFVPTDLFRVFEGPEDHRVYVFETAHDVVLPIYHYPVTPGRCLNCDQPRVTRSAPLYCSELCKQTAKVVRYARACHRDGRIIRPDVQEAIQMRVAHILAGGYPEKARHVPDELRESVLRDARNHCQKCGRSFDDDDLDATATIQHMSGNSLERSNLQAWCRRCNMGDAQSRFTPLPADSPQSNVLDSIRARWEAPSPLRACDDDERWEALWRGYARSAKSTLALEEAPSIETA